MRNSVIAIQSIVITTILHALLVPVFFEMDNNAFGEKGANFVDDDDDTFYRRLFYVHLVITVINILY